LEYEIENYYFKLIFLITSTKIGMNVFNSEFLLPGHSVKCFVSLFSDLFILKTEKSKKGCPTNEFLTNPSKYFFSKWK
jgi:hypothetical protein